MTSVGDYAFSQCNGLLSITIPRSVTSIGYNAFEYCYKLSTVNYVGTKENWNNIIKGELFGGYNQTDPNIVFMSNCKSGHSYKVTKKAKAATCTASGNTEGKTCTVCGYTVASKTIKATGHKYTSAVTAATTSANGKIITKCTTCGNVSKTSTIYKIGEVKLNYTKLAYTGSARTPVVTVKNSQGTALKNGTDYTVTYPAKHVNVGRYSVKVTFKGNYKGTVNLSFDIVPKATTIKKIANYSTCFRVYWNTQKSNTNGYLIRYSKSSSMSNSTYRYVNNNSSSSLKVSGLSRKTTYYVQIRTYKTVTVGGKSTKIYSSWSSKKAVKTK